MKFYFAPMEGITGYVYRNLYSEYFNNIDKFFTPFIVGNKKASMKARELRDVLPENNKGLPIVPQILSADSEEFINTARRVQQLGYNEINLNLGCPSGTVVSKGRGSGFLAYPEKLERFLEEVFDALADMKISIKTRLGKESVDEFERIFEIYNKFPMHELIIHPRIQKEMYSGSPHVDLFEKAFLKANFPVCYNGDIFSVKDYERIVAKFPGLDSVMLGRGLLANPFLVQQINGGVGADKEFVREFAMRLFEEYRLEMSGDKDVLFKVKEMWSYLMWLFDDEGKYIKAIRKAGSKDEYLVAVNALVNNCEIAKKAGLFWKFRD